MKGEEGREGGGEGSRMRFYDFKLRLGDKSGSEVSGERPVGCGTRADTILGRQRKDAAPIKCQQNFFVSFFRELLGRRCGLV